MNTETIVKIEGYDEGDSIEMTLDEKRLCVSITDGVNESSASVRLTHHQIEALWKNLEMFYFNSFPSDEESEKPDPRDDR